MYGLPWVFFSFIKMGYTVLNSFNVSCYKDDQQRHTHTHI